MRLLTFLGSERDLDPEVFEDVGDLSEPVIDLP